VARDQNRTADSSVFVRMKKNEKALLERAIASQVAKLPEAKITVGRFLLTAGLEKARKIVDEAAQS
jgi:hypothetical protein